MNLEPIEALGTIWYIEFFETVSDVVSLHVEIAAWLEEFESRYSRFRLDSWLSILNRTREYQEPDPQFVDLLTQSLKYYHATEGVFNVAVGERLTKSGYDEGYTFTAANELPAVPALSEVLDIAADKISLQSGSLDLGGIGKGYAIDKLADHLRQEYGLCFFLINGGGDLYATSDHYEPVTITLAHPDDRSLAMGTVNLKHSGFAASSPRLRAWRDPKTGESYNHLQTKHNVASYVVAPSATEADVWATVSCLNQTIKLPPKVHQLLINESGQILKDTFVHVKEQNAYNLYKK